MVCSFCGSVINDGDKFCMVCGNAVTAANAAVNTEVPRPDVTAAMPEVHAPEIPDVSVPDPSAVSEPAASVSADNAAETPSGGAYFTDQANAPQADSQPAYTQQLFDQPVYAAPDGQPAYAQQPVYMGAEGQPAYAQPAYAVPDGQPAYAQPVYATPEGQPVYAQPVYAQPVYTTPDGQPIYPQPSYAQPVYGQPMGPVNPAAASLAHNTMIMGIIAICLGFTWFLSPGGIVLGAMALSKSNEYLKQFGPLPTKGKVGRHLGRAGLISGIVISVICLIAILTYIVEEVM